MASPSSDCSHGKKKIISRWTSTRLIQDQRHKTRSSEIWSKIKTNFHQYLLRHRVSEREDWRPSQRVAFLQCNWIGNARPGVLISDVLICLRSAGLMCRSQTPELLPVYKDTDSRANDITTTNKMFKCDGLHCSLRREFTNECGLFICVVDSLCKSVNAANLLMWSQLKGKICGEVTYE